MYVIGTAGHVDHGKSALVHALTGIDPDRLREEKERGMTLDLGFAWLQLPSGREVSIIDVPGHERFIKNMLAGVGGIDLALLVVAADEGVMPQTREHLAILDLLQIRTGLVVLTKKDLVDHDWLELVQAEVEEVLKGTTLEGTSILAVSSVTGEGLDQLKAAIDALLDKTAPKKDTGHPRLPIDRVFSMSGFGTVVTGTLIDGSLSTGQEAELVPSGLRTRIRGLQSHRKKLEQAQPGIRLAVNLTGVSPEDIQRGDVLTTPGRLKPTIALDAKLRVVPGADATVKHNATVTFHSGSSETLARVRLLEVDEVRPGEETWVQIRLERPVPLVKGDFFIVRSPQTTLGGGTVVDPFARRHRRYHLGTLQRLETLEKGSLEEVLLAALESQEPATAIVAAQRSNVPWEEALPALQALQEQNELVLIDKPSISKDTLLYSISGWEALAERARRTLESHHRQFPLRPRMLKEEFRSRLQIPPQLLPGILQQLVGKQTVAENGQGVKLPTHEVALTSAQRQQMDSFLRTLERNPYSPPTDITLDPDLINLLEEEGKVVKVSESVVFERKAFHQMRDRVAQRIQQQGQITLGEVRDMFDTSRKYALALLEHLDQQKFTRRVGDARVLR